MPLIARCAPSPFSSFSKSTSGSKDNVSACESCLFDHIDITQACFRQKSPSTCCFISYRSYKLLCALNFLPPPCDHAKHRRLPIELDVQNKLQLSEFLNRQISTKSKRVAASPSQPLYNSNIYLLPLIPSPLKYRRHL